MLFRKPNSNVKPAASPANPKPSSAPESAESGARRGRGRPRKSESVTATNAAPAAAPEASAPVKRGRGRPRKEAVAPQESATRAAESTASDVSASSNTTQPTKRGRGRPRKNPPVQAQAAPETPKRGRGRPRKNPSEISAPDSGAEQTPSAQPVKRGRGRPRKNVFVDNQTPAQESAPQEMVALDLQDVEGEHLPLVSMRKRQGPAPATSGSENTGRGQDRQRGGRDQERGAKPRNTASDSRNVQTTTESTAEAETPRPEEITTGVEDISWMTIEWPDSESRPTLYFRKAQGAPNAVSEIKSEPDSEVATGRSGRRRRGRGGQERTESPKSTPVAATAEVAPEEPVVVPAPAPIKVREVVRIPSEAPQVVVRQGLPTLVRDGRVYPPMFFFANANDESRLGTVLEEIKYAREAGVEVVVHYVDLDVNPDQNADEAVKVAGFLLKRTLEVSPEAQVIFRIVFSAAPGWERTYPRAKYVTESGGLGDPSFCDEEYWSDAEGTLKDFIEKVRKIADADQIMGLHLERGEWFFSAGWGYDTSAAATDAFRSWARMRYRNDAIALCASWFDGQVQFETLTVPEYRGERKVGAEFVQTGRRTRRWVDYHLFLSDIAVERIARLAHVVKKSSEGMFLVGVSYGYTFEWSHPASGHLSLGKLLRTPEVDFIAGPPSYRNREPGGTCPFPGPIDSLALNGKLYISEEDFKTPISGKTEPDDFNPVMKTPQALETVHWRGLGAALAHGSGVCWMDLWGNGWLNSAGIWERGAQSQKALVRRMAVPQADPDVAVFIDERSLSYLADGRAFELLVQNVREAVLRSGLSAGFYLLSDLAHRETFPEAKLYVFTNAWDIRPEVRSAIKTRLQRDNKVLFWLYSAGLFDGGRDALERVREVTGIALKRQPFASKSGTSVVHRKHPLCEALPERLLGTVGELEPSYFAIPEDGLVLAEYTSTGLPSFVVREFQGETPNHRWKSVFLGEPVVTPALFRALGQMAGAHVWNFHEDLVHVRAPFVTIHCNGAGSRTLTLPDKAAAYNLNRNEWVPVEGSQLRFSANDGSTHTFLIGLRSEIESILQTPSDALLRMTQIPERPENTINLDDVHFDVPIMRLDAWVEDRSLEEGSDESILKPLLFEMEDGALSTEEEPEQADDRRDGRKRRRRRRGRGRGGDDVKAGGSDFDVTEMNVVFRKRE